MSRYGMIYCEGWGKGVVSLNCAQGESPIVMACKFRRSTTAVLLASLGARINDEVCVCVCGGGGWCDAFA